MWGKHDFETIFTSNDVVNIQDVIGNEFGTIEIAYSMVLNAYFCPIRKNRPHATPNYELGNIIFKLIVTYKDIVIQDNYFITKSENTGKRRSRINVFF